MGGWSDQQWGGLALPAALDPIGMPGCSLRVATDAVHLVAGSGGRAALRLPVPVNPALIGARLFQQGCAVDPGANALGLTVTNSVRLTVGHL